LQLLKSSEHKSIHAKELTDEQRQKYRDNLNKNVRPKAIEWHKSKEGREWHKEQWKVSLGKIMHEQKPKILQCIYCGKEYTTTTFGETKFCSNNCKSAYRRKLGVDNVERQCIKCGSTFMINKYSKRKYCYNCLKKKIRRNNGDKMC
jgi:hypothetical protein